MKYKLKDDLKITLTGDLGSGKSTVSKLLCEQTGFAYISTGRIQHKLAADKGMTTLELNRLADSDASIDQTIDGIFIELGKDPDPYIVDSRLAWFFLPTSFKVFLTVQPEEAARRIFSDPSRKRTEQYASLKEAGEKLMARKASENARFLEKYNADCANLDNYDLLVDTSQLSPEKIAHIILHAASRWGQGLAYRRRRK